MVDSRKAIEEELGKLFPSHAVGSLKIYSCHILAAVLKWPFNDV